MGGRSRWIVTVQSLSSNETGLIVEASASTVLTMPCLSFDDVLERHQREIYRFALHLTRNHPDAYDLYQETLIKAYRAFGRLDRDANHRAWLYRIATNTFLSGKRKLNRIDSLDAAGETITPIDPTDHASDLEAKELLRQVEHFVSRLPEKQRVALILRKYHEMSYGDIAMNLKCSEAAARANVHEALRKVKNCFGDRF